MPRPIGRQEKLVSNSPFSLNNKGEGGRLAVASHRGRKRKVVGSRWRATGVASATVAATGAEEQEAQ